MSIQWQTTFTIEKNKKDLTDANNEVGLEVNGGKTKYILLSHHQNAEKIMTQK
jgi:hypothetical protein